MINSALDIMRNGGDYAYKAISKEAFAEALVADRKKAREAGKLVKKLRLWHLGVVNDFVRTIRGGNPSLFLTTKEKEQLAVILNAHYIDVAKAFSLIDLDRGTPKQFGDIVSITAISIRDSVLDLIDDQKQTHIDSIINTTEEEKQKSIAIATESLREGGEAFTNATLAVVTGNILNERLKNREELLKISETNWVAEGTRFVHVAEVKAPLAQTLDAEALAIDREDELAAKRDSKTVKELAAMTYSNTAKEAATIAITAALLMTASYADQLRSFSQKVVEQIKSWITMGDNKVRGSHRAANGQTVRDSVPFSVGFSLLMYPADGSLGAAIKELVRCRCFVYYL